MPLRQRRVLIAAGAVAVLAVVGAVAVRARDDIRVGTDRPVPPRRWR